MKSLVAKSTESGDIDSDEFCEGLLEWLNTPKAHGLSPAEILYGHSIRSIVPATLQSYANSWKEKLKMWDETISTLREKEMKRYNEKAKPLKPLQIGQNVRLQDPVTKKWDRFGNIVGIGKNRDYHVRLPSGRVFWRNRRFVRPAVIEEPEEDNTKVDEDSAPKQQNVHFNEDIQVRYIPPRRSRRRRQNPSRFKDFV